MNDEVRGEVYGLRAFDVDHVALADWAGAVELGPSFAAPNFLISPIKPIEGDWADFASEAVCLAEGGHAVPAPSCRCGLYAFSSLAALEHDLGDWVRVLAVVALEGDVIEHDFGYRAQRMQVVALWMAPHTEGREYIESALGVQSTPRIYLALPTMLQDFRIPMRPPPPPWRHRLEDLARQLVRDWRMVVLGVVAAALFRLFHDGPGVPDRWVAVAGFVGIAVAILLLMVGMWWWDASAEEILATPVRDMGRAAAAMWFTVICVVHVCCAMAGWCAVALVAGSRAWPTIAYVGFVAVTVGPVACKRSWRLVVGRTDF